MKCSQDISNPWQRFKVGYKRRLDALLPLPWDSSKGALAVRKLRARTMAERTRHEAGSEVEVV